jgi:hypothetical protein
VRVLGREDEAARELRTSRYDSLEALSQASRRQALAEGRDPAEWTFFMRVARERQRQTSGLWPPEGAWFERATTIRVDHAPDDIALVYEELGEPVEVTVNGRSVEAAEPRFVWDRANRAVSLRGRLHLGENTIALREHMPAYRSLPPGAHGLEPVVLTGSFAVRDGTLVAPSFALDGPASWSELGWPNYSGAMRYHAQFDLAAVHLAGRLLLECEDVRETMEVEVNGVGVGVRPWPPYRLDITAAARPGPNRLTITVTNTLSNLLTRPLPSGLLGSVRIVAAHS